MRKILIKGFLNFTNSNTTHTDTLTDGQYLVVWTNTWSTATGITDLNTSLYNERILKEWKVENTNSAWAINLDFDGFDGSWVLLTDSDGDFTSGAVNAGALSGSGEMLNITLADDSYFTLAQINLDNPALIDTDSDGVADILDLDDDNDGILDTIETIGSIVWYENLGNWTTGSYDVENVENIINAFSNNTFLGITNTSSSNFWYYIDGSTVSYENINTGATGSFTAANVDNTIAAFNNNTFLGVGNASGNGTFGYYIDGSTVSYENLSTWATGSFTASNVNNTIAAFNNGTLLWIVHTGTQSAAYYVDGNTITFENLNFGWVASFTSTSVDNSIAAYEINAFLWTSNTGGGNFGYIVDFIDTDNDGIPNYQDLDSDGDGIPDNIEAQANGEYIVSAVDSPSLYVSNKWVNSAYSGGLTPVDTDSATNPLTPDYIDTDSDDAQTDDETEAGLVLSGIVGVNGLDDAIETSNTDQAYADVNWLFVDEANFNWSVLPDANTDGIPDWRSANIVAPGWVSGNLGLWLKADTWVSTGATMIWADQWNSSLDVSQTSVSLQPTYNTSSNLLNFNPSLTFTGDNLFRTSVAVTDIHNVVGSSTRRGSAFFAGDMSAEDRNPVYIHNNGGWWTFAFEFGSFAGAWFGFWASGNSNLAQSQPSGGVPLNTPFIGSTRFSDLSTPNITSYFNGGFEDTSADLNWSGFAASDILRVWASLYDGRMWEIISYTSELSVSDQQKIESYLALKYGITLDQTTATDYVSSAGTGTLMWDSCRYRAGWLIRSGSESIKISKRWCTGYYCYN